MRERERDRECFMHRVNGGKQKAVLVLLHLVNYVSRQKGYLQR